MKAIRTGAVAEELPPILGAASTLNGLSDSMAGSATQAPSPRRNRRRLK
jgi:hypothetical protein